MSEFDALTAEIYKDKVWRARLMSAVQAGYWLRVTDDFGVNVMERWNGWTHYWLRFQRCKGNFIQR